MTSITIHLEDDLARQVEEAARREQNSVLEWVKDRVRPGSPSGLANLESVAQANGYLPAWTTLYASLSADESFTAPTRSSSRPIPDLD